VNAIPNVVSIGRKMNTANPMKLGSRKDITIHHFP